LGGSALHEAEGEVKSVGAYLRAGSLL